VLVVLLLIASSGGALLLAYPVGSAGNGGSAAPTPGVAATLVPGHAGALSLAPRSAAPSVSARGGASVPAVLGLTGMVVTPSAKAVPNLNLTPSSGPVGTVVTFVATNFAHTAAFSITWTVGTACAGDTDSHGNFTCEYQIPLYSGGDYTFTATDAKGNSAPAEFDLLTAIVLSPSSGLVGTHVTIAGTGFAQKVANKAPVAFPVKVTYPGGTACSANTTGLGSFNCTWTVPELPRGSVTLTAVVTNATTYTATAKFSVVSGLSVGPTYGIPGTVVTFSGTGFGANATANVTWTLGPACGSTVQGKGVFSCTYTIPASTAGIPKGYLFTAADTSNESAKATTVFTVSWLNVTPATGPVGTVVTFAAGGFAPNVPVVLRGEGARECASSNFSSNGSFSCTWTVAAAGAGNHVFTVSDSAGEVAETTFTIEPTLTIPVIHGASGVNLTFTGSGFGANQSVAVTWLDGKTDQTACTAANTHGTGAFSCYYLLPSTTSSGSHTFTATDTAGDFATVTYTVSGITIVPGVGPVGTSGSLNAIGFAPQAKYSTTIDGVTLSACSGGTVTTNGTFQCTIRIPYEPGGLQTISSNDGAGGDSAMTLFNVTPELSANVSSLFVGRGISFETTGFAAHDEVTISWFNGTSTNILCENVTLLGSSNCTLPGWPAPTPVGTYKFTATDTVGDSASTYISILPHLRISPAKDVVGGLIYLNTTGFAARSTLNISSTLGPICLGTTNAVGILNCTYTIPAAAAGSYSFTAADGQGDTATASVTVGPTLTIGPVTSGPVGTLITFVGAGFIASGKVNVTWSETVPSSQTVHACSTVATNPEGGFTCSYAIPTQPPETISFTATDSAKIPDKASATFTVVPSLFVSPTSGSVGTNVTFTGYGFPASSSSTTILVQVSWSGGLACAAGTNTVGTFVCSYVIPSAFEGSHTFTASYGSYSASAVFTVNATLTITPSSGPVGTLVTFEGTGFAPNNAMAVNWSGGLVACSSTTNSAGQFTCTYTIPNATYGPHEFYAQDKVSANANFTVTPQLVVTPTSGLSGTPVSLTATGFAGSSSLTITWSGGDTTACSGTTTATGSLTCGFTVPSGSTGGLYSFTATDALDHSAVASFSVSTSLLISPNHGPAGTTVTFTGSGFAADSALSLTWGQVAGSVCSASTTNASGQFTCTYTIPSGTPGGSYTFTAVDHASNTATATFVVTFLKAAPAGATAGSSVTFSMGGFASLSHMTLTWGALTACTGTSSTSGTFSCTYTIPAATTPGPYTFTATDAVGGTASVVFNVFGVPSVSVPTGNRTGADVGQSVTFSTTASGGSGTYSQYTWTQSSSLLGCTLANSASITCVPTQAGTSYTVSVYVTDSNGVPSGSQTSAAFRVSTDPVVSVPTASPSTSVDVGQTVTFSATASGGYGTLTYSWSGLPTGCTGTTASISCQPTASVAGTHIAVTVTDGNGFEVPSAALVYTVYGDPTVTTPSATRGTADVGQEVTFSVTASGGSEGFTYAWFGLSALGCSGTSANVTCVPTSASAGATIWVNVTDSNGFVVRSSSIVYTVYSDPTITTPAANRTSIDLGSSVTFTTSGAGGSGGLVYAWHNLPAGCTSISATTISCTPSAAVAATPITVTVTDSNGFMVTSSALSYTVYADPSAGTPTASPTSADVNESVTFTVPVSGGSGGLTVVWSGLPTGCSGTAAIVQCTAGAPTAGTYNISAKVTDSNGYSSTSAVLEFLVVPQPVVSAITASVSSADVGQTVKFSVTASLGSGGYTYVWSNLPDPCSGTMTSQVTCVPSATVALAKIYVTVKDSNGFTVTSAVLDFTVYADPVAGAPVAAPATADQGQDANLSTVITGGSGGGTYTWTNLPTGCSPDGATVACVSLPAGTFSITVTFRDSNGLSSTSSALAFTVSTDPSVTTPKASVTSVDVGQKVTFTTTETGGYGTMTYTWMNLPTGCTGTTTTTVSCTPTAAASALSIYVIVKDQNGFSTTSTPVLFTVYTKPTVTVSVSPTSVLQGHSVAFTGAVAGGSGGFSYTWSGLPSGCTAPTSGLTFSCSPSSAATFQVELTATDSNGVAGSANVTLTVNPTFLGLPQAEGYGVLAGAIVAVLAVLIVLVLLIRRRRRRAAQSPVPWAPTPSTPAEPEMAAPPTGWAPPTAPAPIPEGSEEPSPWELPAPETEPSEPGAPPPPGPESPGEPPQ